MDRILAALSGCLSESSFGWEETVERCSQSMFSNRRVVVTAPPAESRALVPFGVCGNTCKAILRANSSGDAQLQ